MARESVIDKAPIFYFDGSQPGQTLGAGQAIFQKQGLAAQPAIQLHGQRRLVGNFTSDQVPGAGSPILQFNINGSGSSFDLDVGIPQDITQPGFAFPFDIPIFLPFLVPNFVNGGVAGAIVRVAIWAYPEGAAPPIFGGSPAGPKPPILLPKGFEQLIVTDAAAAPLAAVPAGALYAYITVDGFNVRFRDDGGAPTAAIGTLIQVGSPPFLYNGDLNAIRFIGTDPGNSAINVQYYA